MDQTPAPAMNFTIDPAEWTAATLSSLFDSNGLLASGLLFYNTAILSVAGLMILWVMLRIVIATGQHGEVGGKHSEIWFPIRLFIALGIITPLPPTGLSGGQQLMIYSAEIGSNVANQLWSRIADDIGKMKPLVVPVPPDIRDLAHGVWLIESCIAVNNITANAIGMTPAQLVTHRNDNDSVLSGDTDQVAQCGGITFPYFADPMAIPINLDHIKQTVLLAETLRPAAQAIARRSMPPYPQDEVIPSLDISTLVQNYSSQIMNTASHLVEMSNSSMETRAAFAKDAAAGGWVQAGGWALRVMSTNAQLSAAMAAVPKTAAPRIDMYDGWGDSYTRAAIYAGDSYWVKAMGKGAPEIDAKGFGAGTQESWFAPIDIARWQALYAHLGTASADVAVNPMAEISNLGHGLLVLTSGAVETYAAIAFAGEAITKVLDSIPVIGKPVAAVAGAISSGITKSVEKTGPAFWMIIGMLWVSGLTLAYGLPMLPYVYWLLVVARFLTRVLTGVLAVPLWGIAHLELDGEGLGSKTQSGYMLLIDNFVRPMVSVLALLLGLAAYIALAKLFFVTFYPAIQSALAGHYGGWTGLFAFTLLSVAVLVLLMHHCMRIVIEGADDVLEMAGALVARTMGGQDHHTAAGGAVALGGAQKAGGVATQAGRVAGGAGGNGRQKKDEEGTWRPSKMGEDIGGDYQNPNGHGGVKE
jgi:conjugal transfer/type IV secretion protein DotA/TraY